MIFHSPQICHAPEGGPAGGAPAADQAPAADPPAVPPSMPDGLPTEFWDQSTGVRTDALIASHAQLSAAAQAAGEGVPEEASGYELSLPENFEIPAGLEIKFDENDETLKAGREMALDLGLSQESFRKLLTFDATRKIDEYKKVLAEDAAEKEKLGAQGEARISAVESWLKQNINQEQYEALRPIIWKASAFEGIETLMKKASASRVSSEQPGGPPPPDKPPERMADRWFNKSTEQKAG